MPLTFYLQCAAAGCLLLLALSALALARRIRRASETYWPPWWLTAVAFTLHATNLVVQNVFAGLALHYGDPSPVMDAYLRAATVFNHSRTFLMMGLCVGLGVLAVWRKPLSNTFWRGVYLLLGIGLLAGGVVGAVEGPWMMVIHYTAVAVWDVVELLLLFAALFLLLINSTADRYLWAMLAFYAASLALGVFWSVALAQAGAMGGWAPPRWSNVVVRLLVYIIMLGFVLRRLALARRRVAVPGMFDSPRIQSSLLG